MRQLAEILDAPFVKLIYGCNRKTDPRVETGTALVRLGLRKNTTDEPADYNTWEEQTMDV